MDGTENEIVRRVALAIDEVYDGWVDVPPSRCRELSTLAARAAIEAMRLPTKAMLDDGWYGAHDESAEACWELMIDAALATNESPAPEEPLGTKSGTVPSVLDEATAENARAIRRLNGLPD